MFFEAVLRDNRPISDFIDGKYTFLNERLAKHYGIEGVKGPDFRRVDLTTDQRSGVFTQASVLTVSSYPTRTSVVLRGKYLLENLLTRRPRRRRPTSRRSTRRRSGPRPRSASRWRSTAPTPLCAPATPAWIRSASGSRTTTPSAGGAPRTASSRWTPSGALPERQELRRPGGDEGSCSRTSMPEFARCLAEKMLTYSLGQGRGERTTGAPCRTSCGRPPRDEYRIQTLSCRHRA